MSSAVSVVDTLIKEYLVFRGFTSTLKQLEVDLRNEKERGFKVDKVIDHIVTLIYSFDLNGLRELWEHINAKVFLVLDRVLSDHATKLENDLYKLYLVHCVQNRRNDKATEFFELMTPSLHQVDSWHEWFGMPYLQKPNEHSQFKLYFTKEWQENYFVSLSNFFSVAFHQMHLPTLLSYFAEQKHASASQNIGYEQSPNNPVSNSLLRMQAPPPDVVASAEVMDDFYVIAQESPSTPGNKSLASAIKKKFGATRKDRDDNGSSGSRSSLKEAGARN